MYRRSEERPVAPWRQKIWHVIFEAENAPGRLFDFALLAAIVLSVLAVMLESVVSIEEEYGAQLRVVEWVFTALFSAEYLLRLVSVRRPLSYAFSFFGLIDLAAVLPTYLSLLIPGSQSLLVVRAFRLLRIFRVLKAVRWLSEADTLARALRSSLRKILVFMGTVLIVVLVMGAVMYLIEGEENDFTSIPQGMYWAIVTMTTVGYGDIAPHTVWGKFLAACLMIMGYGIIAVPTGIVSVELAQVGRRANTITCPDCLVEGHAVDAHYCRACGAPLYEDTVATTKNESEESTSGRAQ